MSTSKRIYNPDSEETFEDAKIFGGNPTGVININATPHKWAFSIYKLQQSYTWFTSECSLANDRGDYLKLTNSQRHTFDAALAQVILNDSVQTKQLTVGVSEFITSPAVSLPLTRQAYEEAEHTVTYGTIADEICKDEAKIFSLDKHIPELRKKNDAVAEMYNGLASEVDDMSLHDKFMILGANQILEELVFPGTFLVLWNFRFTGVSKAIGFIERDESGTHVPLFKNIYRAAVRENGIDERTKIAIRDMVIRMTTIEKEWLNYLGKDIRGFTPTTIDMFVELRANNICENLYIDLPYKKTDGGPLQSMYSEFSMLGTNKDGSDMTLKTNFFETTVGDYAVGLADDDY